MNLTQRLRWPIGCSRPVVPPGGIATKVRVEVVPGEPRGPVHPHGYGTPIFLSYPKPKDRCQERFIERLCEYLESRDFAPRTLGVTDYDLREPLTAIRKLMLESYGLITIAFCRTHLKKATRNFRSDLHALTEDDNLDNKWLTSPWAQIEPAMAFQIGLPIMVMRESGVIEDGVLQKGVVGIYMPEFDLSDSTTDYLESREWRSLIRYWEAEVRAVEKHRGEPPRPY